MRHACQALLVCEGKQVNWVWQTNGEQVALRNIRRNALEAVKKLEKGDAPISEDESKQLQVMPHPLPHPMPHPLPSLVCLQSVPSGAGGRRCWHIACWAMTACRGPGNCVELHHATRARPLSVRKGHGKCRAPTPNTGVVWQHGRL